MADISGLSEGVPSIFPVHYLQLARDARASDSAMSLMQRRGLAGYCREENSHGLASATKKACNGNCSCSTYQEWARGDSVRAGFDCFESDLVSQEVSSAQKTCLSEHGVTILIVTNIIIVLRCRLSWAALPMIRNLYTFSYFSTVTECGSVKLHLLT